VVIINNIKTLQKLGLVIRGEEHIEGLIKDLRDQDPYKLLAMLMAQGRGYGITFHRDPAGFDEFQFIHKLGEMGFEVAEAKQVVANLWITPAPEANAVERF
jgi:hypothetical protein